MIFNGFSSQFRKLQPVHSKSELDIVNLESVFSAFEMAELLDVSPSQPELLTSMKRLITWTLDESMRFSLNGGRIVSSGAYQTLARLIFRLSEKQQHGPTCTVISFNYDFAVDAALYGEGLNPDYGLTEHPSGAVNLFKLHGSVNWHRCAAPTCKKIDCTDDCSPPQ